MLCRWMLRCFGIIAFKLQLWLGLTVYSSIPGLFILLLFFLLMHHFYSSSSGISWYLAGGVLGAGMAQCFNSIWHIAVQMRMEREKIMTATGRKYNIQLVSFRSGLSNIVMAWILCVVYDAVRFWYIFAVEDSFRHHHHNTLVSVTKWENMPIGW